MSIYESLRASLVAKEPVALATLISGPPGAPIGAKMLVRPRQPAVGSLGQADLDRVVARDTEAELAVARTGVRHYGPTGEARRTEDGVSIFVESFAPPPRMIIFGAVDFTAALTRVGRLLGYHVVVCDARPVFATKQRFPWADEVVADWPDRYLAAHATDLGPNDAVCVLTHDPKFDVPAIVGAVATDVGYLGAMGSRRTTVERAERLREVGLSDDQIARVMGPIGLDIGARSPEETAVAIAAEIIAVRTGRAESLAASLRDASGPIHRR